MQVLNKNKEQKVRTKKIQGPMERMRQKAFTIIMIPYVVFLVLTKGLPFVWAVIMSFTNYTGFNIGNMKFVGLNNYIRVFTDADAIPSIGRAALIAIIVVPITVTLCLMLSLMLNQKMRGIGFFRTAWYLPSIVPGVATVMMWRGMFIKNGGVFNQILSYFGYNAIDWMDFGHVQMSLIIMLLWGAGGGILTNISAMKSIPTELYEAADIEGAGFFTQFRKITLPLISNMIYMNIITGLMSMLQLFAQPVMLSGEGGLTATPIRPIYTYMVHVYQQIFVNMRFGYGLAMVFLIFILIMALTWLAEKTSKLWVYSEVD